ncbi:MAG TPA: hypothetical protein VMU80_27555 [Bryobacteraceae bacterium]|nr:hypothetical protein [Bryobacteraceae bacterium]
MNPSWKKPKTATRDNLLMKAMGADPPYRYDPEPPRQYLWDFRHAKTSREVLKAWVKMGTVALGRHSPFVIDAHGRAQGIDDLIAATGWGRKHAERELFEAERDGIIRRDPELRGKSGKKRVRRIFLRADVPIESFSIDRKEADSKAVSDELEFVHTPFPSPSVRLEPYLKKQVEALPPDVKQDVLLRYLAIEELGGELESDALAAARTITEQLHNTNWQSAGVTLRSRKKRRAHPAQPSLLDWHKVTAGYVQLSLALNLPESVQPPVPQAAVAGAHATQPPQESLLDAAHSLSTDAGVPAELESVRAQKSNVHAPTAPVSPTSSMKNPPPLYPNTVRNTNSVSQSPTDRPTEPPAVTKPTPQGRPRQTRPVNAETPVRLALIAAAIPDWLAERLGELKSLNLLRQIDFALQGLPSEELQLLTGAIVKVERANPRKWTSLGLCIKLAEAIGHNWMAGAAKREKAAVDAELARHAEESSAAECALLLEYSEFRNRTAQEMFRQLSAEMKQQRVKEKSDLLRNEGRLARMIPENRTREIENLILFDLAKDVPTYDEWLGRRTK